MTDPDRMVAWLRGAMDAAQRDAETATPGPWDPEGDDPTDDIVFTVYDGEQGDLVGGVVAYARGGYGKDPGSQLANMRHIARHDPAAVLRRIAADRKLLAEHPHLSGFTKDPAQGLICGTCSEADRDGVFWGDPYPCATVRLLAEGYGWTEEMTSSGR